MAAKRETLAQAYRVARHRGKRVRPMVSLTLGTDEIELLAGIAAAKGLTKSALVGQLLRAEQARRQPELPFPKNASGLQSPGSESAPSGARKKVR